MPILKLQPVTLGFDDQIADLYWLQFVQYVGDTPARQKDGSVRAQDFIATVTTLAPHFIEPYYFASFIIGAEQKRPEIAAAIIDRGIAANPDNWYLPFIAGFNQYLNARDHVGAARYYKLAAKYPNAPVWLERQARLLETSESSELKRLAVLSGVYQTANSVATKRLARRNLITFAKDIQDHSKSLAVRNIASQQLHLLEELPSE